MKYSANIISFLRIILSISLLLVTYNSSIFITLYLLCGISDILDGYLARKLKIESNFGARIDSFADLIMYLSITYILINNAFSLLDSFLFIVLIVVIIRAINMVISFIKYHSFVVIHTCGNKLTGLLIYIVPLSLNYHWILILVSIIAFLSSIEETLIHIFINKLDLNRKSLFFN